MKREKQLHDNFGNSVFIYFYISYKTASCYCTRIWLIALLFSSPQKAQNDMRTLAYWLSNLSTLTVLLQRSFKTTRTAISTPQRRRFSSDRIFHGNQTSNAGLAYLSGQTVVGSAGLPQVEAKYPALLFKQQLVDLIEKVYGMISDSVKKELNPLLELCIQVLLP